MHDNKISCEYKIIQEQQCILATLRNVYQLPTVFENNIYKL